MIHLFAFILVAIAVEIFLFINVRATVGNLIFTVEKARRVLLSSRISDHWKQVALTLYSLSMIGSSLRLLSFFFLVFFTGYLLGLCEPKLIVLATSLSGFIEFSFLAIIYSRLRGFACR